MNPAQPVWSAQASSCTTGGLFLFYHLRLTSPAHRISSFNKGKPYLTFRCVGNLTASRTKDEPCGLSFLWA